MKYMSVKTFAHIRLYGRKAMVIISRLLPMLVIFCLVYVAQHQLKSFDLPEVINGLSRYSIVTLVIMSVIAILSYCVGGLHDVIAIKHLHLKVPSISAFVIGTLSTIFSTNIGFSALSGAAVRYRLYAEKDVGFAGIAKIMAVNAITIMVGVSIITSVIMLFFTEALRHILPLDVSVFSIRFVGAMVFLIFVFYVYCGATGKAFQVKGFKIKTPSVLFIVYQVLVSTIDWLLMFLVFYGFLAILHGSMGASDELTVFMFARAVGVASNIPAGLGAFDGTILYFLRPAYTSTEGLISALLIYRLAAFLLPFLIAAVIYGAYELHLHRRYLSTATTFAIKLHQSLIPRLAAIILFITGVFLLISSYVPRTEKHLQWLMQYLPHSVIELSHLLESLIGITLLVFARGILYRSRASYFISVALLSAGVVFCMMKGLHNASVIVLVLVLAFFIPTKPFFYRQQASFKTLFSAQWIFTLFVISLFLFWLAQWGHENHDYSLQNGLTFESGNDVPRAIRAMLAITFLLSFIMLIRLIYSPGKPSKGTVDDDIDRADDILLHAEDTSAYLAFLGDKSLMFSDDNKAFIMYAIQGHSWVAMGDPIGDSAAWDALVWKYCQEADKYGAWPVFYEASHKNLPIYLDLGFSIHKIGEKAKVYLPDFTLEGKARSNLRTTMHKMQRLNAHFEIVEPQGVAAILDEMKVVSDDWLTHKKTREKSFSMGRFDAQYLLHSQSIATVRIDGRLIAFTNIWCTNQREEIAIDLMRFTHDSPNSTMDYLFTELMIWAKSQDYQWFSLGMVPLLGLDNGIKTTSWTEFGHLLYRHSEHFYNFEGLYRYKNKFSPEWSSCYLISPGGLRTTFILKDISSLISGGTLGVFKK